MIFNNLEYIRDQQSEPTSTIYFIVVSARRHVWNGIAKCDVNMNRALFFFKFKMSRLRYGISKCQFSSPTNGHEKLLRSFFLAIICNKGMHRVQKKSTNADWKRNGKNTPPSISLHRHSQKFNGFSISKSFEGMVQGFPNHLVCFYCSRNLQVATESNWRNKKKKKKYYVCRQKAFFNSCPP